ncbi:MAG TPA: hypothetical protein VI704_07420 [Bacteroidota bacterium]|nr:hypothetical protein [Bacteroidota bacterium]
MMHLSKGWNPTVNILAAVFVILALIFSSCGKPQAPVINEWELYQDPFYGFELQYPKGWLVNAEANKIKIYSSQEAATQFFDPAAGGKIGVEILFGFEKFSAVGVGTLDAYKGQTKEKLSGIGTVGAEKPAILGKEAGEEVLYSSKINKSTTIFGRRIIAARDSIFYYVNLAGFNDDFTLYSAVFDTVLNSIRLPQPKAKSKDPNEAAKPSADFTKYTGEFLDIQYPYNFQYTLPAKKGETIFALQIKGLRADSDIMIDILPAQKLTVEKVFEQNKGKFNPKSTGDATIDGNPAKYLTTSPASNIERRVYFTVKNDKMYRVILTWNKPMTSDFQPAFERSVASLKIK